MKQKISFSSSSETNFGFLNFLFIVCVKYSYEYAKNIHFFPLRFYNWHKHKRNFRIGINIPKELKLFYNYEMQTNHKYKNNNLL